MAIPLIRTTAKRLIECVHNVIANMADGLCGGEVFANYVDDSRVQFPHELRMYVLLVVKNKGGIAYYGAKLCRIVRYPTAKKLLYVVGVDAL